MKNKSKASPNVMRRLLVTILCLFSAVANSSFFTLHSSFSYAQTQTGTASFYSKRWTGRRTSNGEKLHHDSMTCAHRKFAFGTLLRVTNLKNDSVVVVRVNDRGPYVRGRIIDLSWGAAQRLDIHQQGIAKVRIEKIGMAGEVMPDVFIDIPYLSYPFKPIWIDRLNADSLLRHNLKHYEWVPAKRRH